MTPSLILNYLFLRFTCTTLYNTSTSVFTTVCSPQKVSIYHYAVDPLYPLHHPQCPFPLDNHYSVSVFISVMFGLVVYFIFYIPHMSKNTGHLSFSIWLISLSIIPSRSIHVVSSFFFFFFGWIVLCCTHILHHYPFIHWWALRLCPYLGYYK